VELKLKSILQHSEPENMKAQSNFTAASPHVWNSLPSYLQCDISYGLFKRKLFRNLQLSCVRGEHKPACCRCFATVTLRLTPWPWNSTSISIFRRCISELKMKLLGQAVQNILPEMKQFESSSQPQRSRSDVTDFQQLLVWGILLPSYINFWSLVFEILCRQTHRCRQEQYLLAA